MNTNEILRKNKYNLMSNFGQIAKDVSEINFKNEHQLLDYVKIHYGEPDILTTQETQPYWVWGMGEGGRNNIEEWEKYNHSLGDALLQLETALRTPVAVQGALMPDAHYGYALPIGGVLALDNAVSPYCVGVDISCMVMLTILDVGAADYYYNREWYHQAVRDNTLFGMTRQSLNRQHEIMSNYLWNKEPFKDLKPLAQQQLGSSGGGNHFADLMIVQGGKFDNQLALLTHSGSRGTGAKLAKYFSQLAKKYTDKVAHGIPNHYEWLSLNTGEGQLYMECLELMGGYAYANHETIHNHFVETLGSVHVEDRIWNKHNFAWEEEGLIVHRKGATPAHKGQVGIIPATSGSDTHVVVGKGDERSLNSSSHGAGRPYSRKQAKKLHDNELFRLHMETENIAFDGLAADETIFAYKDIDEVMKYQEELVETLYTLKPVYVRMGGTLDDGDEL